MLALHLNDYNLKVICIGLFYLIAAVGISGLFVTLVSSPPTSRDTMRIAFQKWCRRVGAIAFGIGGLWLVLGGYLIGYAAPGLMNISGFQGILFAFLGTFFVWVSNRLKGA